jgi:hypothetical protein
MEIPRLIECYRCPSSMSVLLIYIRQSRPLAMLRLLKPASEFTYVTTLSSLPSTMDSQVLTPRSIQYFIKVICSYCDTIAIGNTLFESHLVWSQSSTNRCVSPRGSESALSNTHRVRNSFMIAASNRTLNLLCLIGAIYTVFCNWAVCHILNGEYPTPLRACVKSHLPQNYTEWSK